MSSQPPPDPITSLFNPSAWNLPELTTEEQAVLDANYIKFPIAQNAPISFPAGIITPTLTSGGALEIDLPAASRLDIGNVGSRSGDHHYSDGNNATTASVVHFNNGTNNNSHTDIHNGAGANASGEVNIMTGSGNTGTITIGANGTSTVMNGTFTLNKPITVGYAPSTITTTSMIGYTVEDPITLTTTLSSGAFQNLFTPITLPAGIWLVNFSVRYVSASSSTITDIYTFGLDSVNGNSPAYSVVGGSTTQVIGTSGIAYAGSFVVSSTGSTTYTLQTVPTYSGGNISIQTTGSYRSLVKRTRIA